MWKAQCLCTSNRGTCFTVSHVSTVLIYVCVHFGHWTEICSGTTSNRVAKVKCLPFLWQLLPDHWCQHALHKHPRITLCLSVCEYRHVRSHRPVAGYATVRHYTAAVSPSMQQAFFIDVFARMKDTGWIAQPQLRSCIPRDNPHCMRCDYAIAICVSMVSSYYWEEGTEGWHCDFLQCCYGRQFF